MLPRLGIVAVPLWHSPQRYVLGYTLLPCITVGSRLVPAPAEATLRRIWQAAGGSPLPGTAAPSGSLPPQLSPSWWREYPEGRVLQAQNNTLPEREIDSPDSPVSAP